MDRTDATLATLLDGELDYDATTTDRLTNHLPMALVALHRLGASDDRLDEFARRYRARLAPSQDAEPVASFDAWLAARGRRHAYGAVRAYLGPLVEADGVESVVRRFLPHLVNGLSGAAFHGIIRLAYALDSASPARVAAGLAYLTEVHQPLGPRGVGGPITDDPLVALRQVAELRPLRTISARGNIGERMRHVASHPSFAGIADWLEPTSDAPCRLTGIAAALYAATDDFTALHGLTASHAITVVTPYVDDTDALSVWWFQALVAAYLTIGAPPLDDPASAVRPWLEHPVEWAEVERAATASDDEHVVKLVYSARELGAKAGDPLLAAAAARQAGIEPDGAAADGDD